MPERRSFSVIVSQRSTRSKSVSSSWKPSGRLRTTFRKRLILAGERRRSKESLRRGGRGRDRGALGFGRVGQVEPEEFERFLDGLRFGQELVEDLLLGHLSGL